MWEEKREVESKMPDIPNLIGWEDCGITGRETKKYGIVLYHIS